MTTILPTIHINGTSPEDLLETARKALDAVRDAQEAVANMCPNGRDYYPAGPEAFTAARNQFTKRLEALQAVYDGVMAIAVHCADAVEDKRQRQIERDMRADLAAR